MYLATNYETYLSKYHYIFITLLEAVNSVRCKINAEFIAKPLNFAQILMTFCTVVNFLIVLEFWKQSLLEPNNFA